VDERSIAGSDGRSWTFRPRPEIRKDEAGTHVVLLVESLGETRIVSCLRKEWEGTLPDLAGLLARSVPAGGSRGVGHPDEPVRTEPL
jgi:hypothetical protein